MSTDPVTDPFTVLGLDAAATADEVRAAHRRLAKAHHPDVGGDPARMRAVNGAVTAALAAIDARAGAGARSNGTTPPPRPGPSQHVETSGAGRRVVHDTASFTVEALPAEAFEALVVVTSWLGEVLVDDPPYVLEVHIAEPPSCWCRLELVPDAGASTVSLTVAPVEIGPMPDIDAVRDVWVAALNRLDWSDLDVPRHPSRP